MATVSEKVTGSTLYKRVLYTRSLTPRETHIIAVIADGNGRMDLDAILTLSSVARAVRGPAGSRARRESFRFASPLWYSCGAAIGRP